MSFSNFNPSGYTGVHAKFPPEQLINQTRSPTTADFRNRIIGDEWQDQNTTWWKLCSVANSIADWRKYAGPYSTLLSLTAGDAVVVTPDINQNITFVNGNGVASTGGVSSITFNMNSPFTGDFTFRSITGGDPEVLTIQHTVNTAPSNASVNIQVAGTAGQDAWVQTGVAGAASYAMGIDTSTANDPWKLTFDSAGNATPSSPIIGASWDPILGTMTFPEIVQANQYNLKGRVTPGSYVPFAYNGGTTVNADGDVFILKGTNIDGILMVSWQTNQRAQNLKASIRYLQFSNKCDFHILENDDYQSQPVLTNFRFYSDNTNAEGTLVVSVGNRNGSNGPLVATFISSGEGDSVELFPAIATLTTEIPFQGMWQEPNSLSPLVGWIKDSTTNNFSECLGVYHETYASAGNNIGSAFTFYHKQADGTVIRGSNFYTQAPNASTNVQNTNFFIQNNNVGTLTDVLEIDHQGQITQFLTNGGLPAYYPFNLRLRNIDPGANLNIWLQPYISLGTVLRYYLGFGAHTDDGVNLITDADTVHNGANGILGWVEGTMCLYGIASTGTTSQTVPISSLKTVDIDPNGFCYAYKFVTKSVTTFSVPTLDTPPADTYVYHKGAGGAADDFFVIDQQSSSGTGAFKIINVGAASQDWDFAATGSSNSASIRYQSNKILETLSTRQLNFYGTSTASQADVKKQATVSTVDATLTTIATIAVAAGTEVEVFARINGTKTDQTQGIFGNIAVGARNTGGGAILIGVPIVNFNSSTTSTISAAVSAGNLLLQVTGVAAENWDWICTYNYTVVS